jgi:hypothetical protein
VNLSVQNAGVLVRESAVFVMKQQTDDFFHFFLTCHSTQVLFLAMMFLAPTPFMVVLRKSDDEALQSADAIGRSVHRKQSTLVELHNDIAEDSTPITMQSGTDDIPESKDGVEMTTATSGGVGGGWRKSVKIPGSSLLRARVLTKENVETRMASRKLAMSLAASQAGGNSMGVLNVENKDAVDVADDPFMDTRLVLLKKYGGGHVPTRVKIGYRLDALKISLLTLFGEQS